MSSRHHHIRRMHQRQYCRHKCPHSRPDAADNYSVQDAATRPLLRRRRTHQPVYHCWLLRHSQRSDWYHHTRRTHRWSRRHHSVLSSPNGRSHRLALYNHLATYLDLHRHHTRPRRQRFRRDHRTRHIARCHRKRHKHPRSALNETLHRSQRSGFHLPRRRGRRRRHILS